MTCTLVVNADDLGASDGVNRGILHSHVHGIVTSASLMVDGPAVEEAVAHARAHPALGIGLHWDLDGRDLADAAAVRAELTRQLEAFGALTDRPPTHVDSHHHVHRRPEVLPIARELVAPLGVPLREEDEVTYVGGFYGQWEWQVTDLEHVRPEFLIRILRDEVREGWTEIGCHPGFVTMDFTSVYLAERETEVETLCDPRVREAIDGLGIRLASYADFPRSR
ncbi:MAG: carbohydrate deacetylase [Solirubrobacteraceae bacterium]